jgi:hypothetical protein
MDLDQPAVKHTVLGKWVSSQPQLTIKRTLPPGRYCVQLVVIDIHGQRSVATQHSLIILAPQHWYQYPAYYLSLCWRKFAAIRMASSTL